jgi:predicted DsbA family dithiol-disulfide isomerase
MKVEIWSDVTCPFCYIAKRKFENALSHFKHKTHIETVWKSFELAPGLKTDPNKNLYLFLSEHRSMTLEHAVSASNQLTQVAKGVGLQFDLSKAIPANSFNAHRLSHFAKDYRVQDKTEEALFKAYFTEGKNVDDISTLKEIAEEIGLDVIELQDVLKSDLYAEEVRQDIAEAKQLGIQSVPYFVFNRKWTIVGVQDSKMYMEKLEKAFFEWQKVEGITL